MSELEDKVLTFIQGYSKKPAPDSKFESLALQVFGYQFRRNEFYRRWCALEKKEPQSVRNWKHIPAMPAAGFRELVLTTFSAKQAVRVFRTSGTTKTESKGTHFFKTLALYDAAVIPPFQKNLIPDGVARRFFFLMPSPAEAPHSSLSYMMGVVNRKFSGPAGKFYIQKDCLMAEDLLKDLRAAKDRPVIILATAFSLKAFLDFLKEKNIRLKLARGSRIMETGGFKGRTREISKSELYALCALRFAVPKTSCISEYGMTELSSQFYGQKVFRGPAWTRTLVIDPATGREAPKGKGGILRHWDLANLYSVMAVETEDRGRQVRGGFELLGRAQSVEPRGCSLDFEELRAHA